MVVLDLCVRKTTHDWSNLCTIRVHEIAYASLRRVLLVNTVGNGGQVYIVCKLVGKTVSVYAKSVEDWSHGFYWKRYDAASKDLIFWYKIFWYKSILNLFYIHLSQIYINRRKERKSGARICLSTESVTLHEKSFWIRNSVCPVHFDSLITISYLQNQYLCHKWTATLLSYLFFRVM